MNRLITRPASALATLPLGALLLVLFTGWIGGATPATAVVGDLTFEQCLASRTDLSGVLGCTDITASTDTARAFQGLLPSPDETRLYAVVPGTVLHFERDASGDLTFASCITSIEAATGCTNIAPAIDGLRFAAGGVLSPDGKHLYVVSFGEEAINQLEILGDGSLGFVQCWSSKSAIGGCTDISATTASLETATSVAISPDGSSVYVGNSNDNDGAISHFQRAADGSLSFAGCLASSPILGCTDVSGTSSAVTGIARIVLSPDGRHVYAGTDGSNAVVHFTRSLANGALTLASCATSDAGQTGCTVVPTNALNDIVHEAVAMSPDGANLYVSGRTRNAITRFSRNATTGELTFVDCIWMSGATTGCQSAGGANGGFRTIESLAVSPDGRNLYAAAFGQDAVLQLDRNPTTGALSRPLCLSSTSSANNGCDKVTQEDSMEQAKTVTVSPDGASVYLGANDALVNLERETSVCIEDEDTLCLNGDRFEVEVTWKDFQGGTGVGSVVPFGSDDSGLMWFFQPDNWELLVKVLDGCAVNGNVWVFVAAVTNVEYTISVRDTETGLRMEYFNPLGNPSAAVTDTAAFDVCPLSSTASAPRLTDGSTEPVRIRLDQIDDDPAFVRSTDPTAALELATATVDPQEAGVTNCVADDRSLCLNGGRFRVEVDWKDFAGGTGDGRVVPFGSDDSGLLWFFAADNWEMLIKVLDGCGLNQNYWVFAAATTNVEYTLTVTDTMTGQEVSYFNPLGQAASAITDTAAFATCP